MYRSDSKGKYVTEGGSSNYFFVKNNNVYTPEIDNILPGITREKAISLLREMGENIVQRRFYFDEIKDADEIFLVSTVSKIMPVKIVDNFSFGIGEKTLKLMKRFEEMIKEYKKSRK
jgi:D-alanine transaminase